MLTNQFLVSLTFIDVKFLLNFFQKGVLMFRTTAGNERSCSRLFATFVSNYLVT